MAHRGSRQRIDAVGTPSVVYDHMREKWEKILDLLEGTDWMRRCGETYLPKEPMESAKQYSVRIHRSFLYNGLKNALGTITGQPFRKKVAVDEELIPEKLNYLPDDVDGKGTDVTEFSMDGFRNMIALGHVFLFADYTAVKTLLGNRRPSKADEKKLGARVIWKIIRAPDMLDWEFEVINGRKTLTMVKFREVRKEKVGKYLDEEREYIHIWRPTIFEIWRAKKPCEYEDTVLGTYLNTWTVPEYSAWLKGFEPFVPETKHTFPGIPIVPVYARRTDDFTSEPPLLELANTNVEHWQSSSDQRNILRFARLAQKVITGAKEKEVNDSARASVHNMMRFQNPQAKAFYLEHSGTGIEAGEKDLDRLEDRMERQGQRPMQQRTQAHTATGSMVDMLNLTSDAEAWVRVFELGLHKLAVISGQWVKVDIPKELSFDIYSDFTLAVSSKEDVQYLESARARGDVSQKTLLNEFKRRNIVVESLDIDAEVEETKAEMAFAAAQVDDEDETGGVPPGDQPPDDEEDEDEE